MKKTIIVIGVVVLIALGGYFFMAQRSFYNNFNNNSTTTTEVSNNINNASSTENKNNGSTVIGKSVDGREILAYHYGLGDEEILFIGGIHGGYEWNTVLLAQQLAGYLKENPEVIPANVRATVIPVLNPDGLNKVVGTTGAFTPANVTTDQNVVVAGRFNANNVDLGRNFDCDWKATSLWQTKTVSGGGMVFSEPEAKALRDYVLVKKPTAVVVWYSSAGGVYSSACSNGILPETTVLTNLYAKAANYPAYKEFNAYKINGDMVNWLAKENIPAISVLLTTHSDVEWDKNLAGVKAVFDRYTK